MYEKEISLGLAYLDEVHPGWESKINLGRLNMLDGDYCLLAQLEESGRSSWLENRYVKYMHKHKLNHSWAVEHGFSWPILLLEKESGPTYWHRRLALTDEWVAVIAKRQVVSRPVTEEDVRMAAYYPTPVEWKRISEQLSIVLADEFVAEPERELVPA